MSVMVLVSRPEYVNVNHFCFSIFVVVLVLDFRGLCFCVYDV
jgi:hypothetical protein